MISHTKQFIVITPPKTGSVSITTALKDHLDIRAIVPQITDCFDYVENDGGPLAKHKSAQLYKKYIPQYTVAGCVRNPFDRVVSWWKWMPKFDRNFTDMPFLTFVEHHIFRNPIFAAQYDFFTVDGEIVLDNIIKFEDMQTDFDNFCSIVDVSKQELPHKNKSEHKHYTEYYDDNIKRIISDRYQKDIEYFNYKFE